jgi:signal transduction histidine kinase
MQPVADFFAANMVGVYFVYGLAFFAFGLAVVVQSGQSSPTPFARVMALLGPFGLVHGFGGWADMFALIAEEAGQPTMWQEALAAALSAGSFTILLVFAVRLAGVAGYGRRWLPYVPAVFVSIFLGGAVLLYAWPPTSQDWLRAVEILGHNWLGLPGSLLTCWALLLQRRTFLAEGRTRFSGDLVGAAVSFAWCAVLDQVIAEPTPYFPGTIINSDVFLSVVGVPVQFLRIASAVAVSYFVIGLLRSFQREMERQLTEANAERLRAQEVALEAQRRIHLETEALNRDLRLATRELSALFETSRILASTLDLDTILRESVHKIVTLLEPAGLGMIYLWDEATHRLNLESQSDPAGMADGVQALGDETAAQVHETGQPVCCPDVDQVTERRRRVGTTNVLGVPLMAQGQIVGALVMVSREGSPVFSAGDLPLVQALGSQLSIAVENARLYTEVADKERVRGQLLDRAVSAQEDERKRIARELHDETGQALSGVLLGLTGVESAMATNPAVAISRLNDLKEFTSQALDELRNLVSDLRPVLLDDLGLIAALRWFANRYQERTGIEVEFTVLGPKRRLDPRVETVLFRVAQEAMTNASKHARASHLSVRLTLEPRSAELVVQDDGRGFDPAVVLDSHHARPAWGLLGIQERMLLVGGAFDLWSEPGAGARVAVTVPLPAQAV